METERSEDGVDLALIRWFLSLTPAERLQVLETHINAVRRTRELNPTQADEAGTTACPIALNARDLLRWRSRFRLRTVPFQSHKDEGYL